MAKVMGSLTVLPIQPRAHRESSLAIVQGIKEGRAPARLLPPLALHDGAAFSAAADEILREAAAIRLLAQQ